MKKQVIVIGGGEAWDTYEEYMDYLVNKEYDPYENKEEGWKKLLSQNLGDEYEIIAPQMPCPRNAKFKEWVIWFEKLNPYLKNNIVLIGHSLGANFLAKYLAVNTLPVKIEQLHLVAGCFGLGGGFDMPKNLNGVEKQCEQIYIYHSKDDFVVDFEDGKKYAKALPSAQFIVFEDRNHFLQSEFPEIVENIKK